MIDLEKIRQKHAEITKQGGGQDFMNNFFQIKEGTNVIRVLPSADEEVEFYAETKIHRVVNAEGQPRNFHCRKVHGEGCPLCDAYYALWKTDSKGDEDIARQIKPRARFYMNIVDRETSDVKILSVGIILFQKILGAMLDEDYGDITDLKEGHDFKIVKVIEGQWPKYDQSAPRPRPEVAGSDAEVAEWMESLHDLQGLVRLEDYEATKEAAQTSYPGLTYDQTVERTVATTEESTTESDDYLERLQA